MDLMNYWDYKCNFVGRIAYTFDLHLQAVCKLHGVQVGKILRSPIEELFHYVVERETQSVDN